MLILYHHGSSACAAKVRFALEEKQLAWESRYVDLMLGEQFSAEYRALNPKAVVPTLIHGNRVLPESTVICEYLDEVFPGRPIYPSDPWQRARVRLWAKAVDEELHPACSALTYIVSHRHSILRRGVGSFEEFLKAGGSEGRMARERKWQWIQQGLAAPGAAEQLAIYVAFIESEWLVGDEFSMADIALAPYVNRLSVLSLDAVWANGRRPLVDTWFQRVRARPAFDPAFIRWVPEALVAEMRANGQAALTEVSTLLGL
jgi:glutathione S-transferase